MSNMAFLPAKITVNVSQNVLWRNSSQVIHNVVDDASKALNVVDVKLPSSVKRLIRTSCNPVNFRPCFHNARSLPVRLHSA
jgi:plastocyanin